MQRSGGPGRCAWGCSWVDGVGCNCRALSELCKAESSKVDAHEPLCLPADRWCCHEGGEEVEGKRQFGGRSNCNKMFAECTYCVVSDGQEYFVVPVVCVVCVVISSFLEESSVSTLHSKATPSSPSKSRFLRLHIAVSTSSCTATRTNPRVESHTTRQQFRPGFLAANDPILVVLPILVVTCCSFFSEFLPAICPCLVPFFTVHRNLFRFILSCLYLPEFHGKNKISSISSISSLLLPFFAARRRRPKSFGSSSRPGSVPAGRKLLRGDKSVRQEVVFFGTGGDWRMR